MFAFFACKIVYIRCMTLAHSHTCIEDTAETERMSGVCYFCRDKLKLAAATAEAAGDVSRGGEEGGVDRRFSEANRHSQTYTQPAT